MDLNKTLAPEHAVNATSLREAVAERQRRDALYARLDSRLAALDFAREVNAAVDNAHSTGMVVCPAVEDVDTFVDDHTGLRSFL